MSREIIKNDFSFWRYLMNFWTVLFLLFIVFDFSSQNGYGSILNILAAVYISVLAIYVGNKEFERWYNRHQGQHPGEMFVIIWTVVMLGLLMGDMLLGPNYEVPGAVVSSYIAVLTILAITRKSKQLYRAKSK